MAEWVCIPILCVSAKERGVRLGGCRGRRGQSLEAVYEIGLVGVHPDFVCVPVKRDVPVKREGMLYICT